MKSYRICLALLLIALVPSSALAASECINLFRKDFLWAGYETPESVKSYSDLMTQLYLRDGIQPEALDPKLVESPAPTVDVPFPKKFTNYLESFNYDDLPPEVKRADDPLYYGRKGGNSVEEAIDSAITLMKFGRGSRATNPHHDILRHQGSTKQDQPSGFFQTTRDFSKAVGFSKNSNDDKFGVIAVIDGRKAEVLDIEKFITHFKKAGILEEYEVLFGNRLSPTRIVSVIIYDKTSRKFIRILQNPRYVPSAY